MEKHRSKNLTSSQMVAEIGMLYRKAVSIERKSEKAKLKQKHIATRQLTKTLRVERRRTSQKKTTRFNEILRLENEIKEAESPTMPKEMAEAITNNPALTQEQKYKAFTDYQDQNIKRNEIIEQLRRELYELQHPIVAKREKEKGERFILKKGARIYIKPEEEEEFYKSYARKMNRPKFADDVKEEEMNRARDVEEIEMRNQTF